MGGDGRYEVDLEMSKHTRKICPRFAGIPTMEARVNMNDEDEGWCVTTRESQPQNDNARSERRCPSYAAENKNTANRVRESERTRPCRQHQAKGQEHRCRN